MAPEYDEDDWTTLLFAPLWAFTVVANIDNKIDHKEWEVMHRAVERAEAYPNELTRDVFNDLKEDFEAILEEFDADDSDPGEGLGEVAELLEEMEEPQVALEFKSDLISLAVETARASGGFPGSKMSPQEKQAVGYLAAMLDLETGEFSRLLHKLNT